MTVQHRQSGRLSAQVVERRTPCRGHFEITLRVDGFRSAEPGQFVQVRCGSACGKGKAIALRTRGGVSEREASARTAPLLRRPFSIAGLRRKRAHCEIDLLGRVVGVGTAWLAALSPGDVVDVLGPLGRGFSAPTAGKRALLVAGGVGLPPIRWLGEKLRVDGFACDAIYGAQTREQLPVTLLEEPSSRGARTFCVEAFARVGIRAAITTDDGTCGRRGRVTDVMVRYLDRCPDPASVQVYACGPDAMLRAIASLCVQREVDCELALERRMGCGMGTCQSCVVPVVDRSSATGWRYALCCAEGPVFDARRVRWG